MDFPKDIELELQNFYADYMGISREQLSLRLDMFFMKHGSAEIRSLCDVGIPVIDKVIKTDLGKRVILKPDDEIRKFINEIGFASASFFAKYCRIDAMELLDKIKKLK